MSALDVWNLAGFKVVFVNHVDCFQTGFIAKYLSGCVVGATLVDPENLEETEEKPKAIEPSLPEATYKIVATLKDPQSPKPHFVSAIIQNKNLQEMLQSIVDCDVVIYDVTTDPSQNAEALFMANKFSENLLKTTKKFFIIISSILTWGSTSSLDQGTPSVINDADYRKRRPHKDYRYIYSSEKQLMQCGRTKKNLNAYVVAPGLVYGDREEIFHYLFKAAWMNDPTIPLIEDGNNFLPTIHIEDLAKVILHLLEKNPRKYNYVVAVDQSQFTLKDITKAINQAMGSASLKTVTKETAASIPELNQMFVDLLTLDLRMSNAELVERLVFEWTSPRGVLDYINQLIQEFKTSRNLKPLKMIILGPPGTGKTTIAKMLQDSHKLHHVGIESIQSRIMADLTKSVMKPTESTVSLKMDGPAKSVEFTQEEEGDEASAEATDDKDRPPSEEYKELLASIESDLQERQLPPAPENISDQFLVRTLKLILTSKPFQNQGFIIDGFPLTGEHVSLLFGTTEEVIEAREKPEENKLSVILPDLIVKLDAEDEFLKTRIRDLPAALVEGTNNEEKAFLARLNEYRKQNTIESSIEDHLDELEFNISFFDVSTDQTGISADILSNIKMWIGPPRIYGPSIEEVQMLMQAATELRQRQEQQLREEEERQLAEEEATKKEKKLRWSKRHQIVKSEQRELNEVQSLPLRHYLFQHVMPTLLKALTQCCTIVPDDPVDYLAEYLLGEHLEAL